MMLKYNRKLKRNSQLVQKPLGNFILDFYAHKPKIVIELDGSQHLKNLMQFKMYKQGILELRFDNRQIELEAVLEKIYMVISSKVV